MDKPTTESNPTLSELRARVATGPPYGDDLLEALRDDPRSGAEALYRKCLKQMEAAACEAERLKAMLAFEAEANANGFSRVAGVDEAGRGPLAGPVVAAAVILSEPIAGLNDSKQLTGAQREALYDELHASGRACIGVATVGADRIDAMGIQSANYAAMAEAAAALTPPADFLLVDGFSIPGCPLPQQRLVKGDSRSLSIAAASIVAKVHRDRLMNEYDEQYPEYGFRNHKGYGTREHLDALKRCGPCPVHRRSFAPLAPRPETGLLFE